jgi:hypothetical protein
MRDGALLAPPAAARALAVMFERAPGIAGPARTRWHRSARSRGRRRAGDRGAGPLAAAAAIAVVERDLLDGGLTR